MIQGKKSARSLAVLSPFLIASLAASGCGGGGDGTGGQVQDIQPEMREKVQQAIYQDYSKQYNAKFAGKKKSK